MREAMFVVNALVAMAAGFMALLYSVVVIPWMTGEKVLENPQADVAFFLAAIAVLTYALLNMVGMWKADFTE